MCCSNNSKKIVVIAFISSLLLNANSCLSKPSLQKFITKQTMHNSNNNEQADEQVIKSPKDEENKVRRAQVQKEKEIKQAQEANKAKQQPEADEAKTGARIK